MSDIFLDYHLPEELIAQQPAAERDQARLLVVRRADGTLAHRTIADLPALLQLGDLAIVNDARVLPARLLGHRVNTGGKWVGLFLRGHGEDTWEILSQTRGRLAAGERIQIEPGPLQLEVVRQAPDRHWIVRPSEGPAIPAWPMLEKYGHVPLPPYIRKGRASAADAMRYQTIFADKPGAVAAPTAGLHFTPTLVKRLGERGIQIGTVTLNVGLGTFQPIQTDDFRKHLMHKEWGELPAHTTKQFEECQRRRGRVIAVGTTTVRVLESVLAAGPLRSWCGETDLFIYPPYDFKAVDVLLTNFHLPRSTLLLLAGAFAGVDLLRQAYRTAIAERYRFYSYGDAMLIV